MKPTQGLAEAPAQDSAEAPVQARALKLPATASQIACVYVPALPLQLLLQRFAAAPGQAVVVVQADAHGGPIAPQAAVVWLNRAARQQGIGRGMTLNQAQGLCANLHADAVGETEQALGVQRLWHALLQFSPGVEPDSLRPGLVWLNPNGLGQVFAGLEQWGHSVQAHLLSLGLHACVAVGFNRLLCYALACAQRPVCVAPSPQAERHAAWQMPLARLHLPAALCAALTALGIHTLGAFLQLSHSEVRQRFGRAAADFHSQAQAPKPMPLRPHQKPVPRRLQQDLEPAVAHLEPLLFVVKNLLQTLCVPLQGDGEQVRALQVVLQGESGSSQKLAVVPAKPTVSQRCLLELVRLRLGATQLREPIKQVVLQLQGQAVRPEQCLLQHSAPRRDVRAAAAALACVRAAFGDSATTVARLCAENLPEKRFVWQPATQVVLPQVAPAAQPSSAADPAATAFTAQPNSAADSAATASPAPPSLVRQVFSVPQRLIAPPRNGAPWWLGPAYGAVGATVGPHRFDTQWWSHAAQRDYFYVQTQHQQWLWLYRDHALQQWFLQGLVD